MDKDRTIYTLGLLLAILLLLAGRDLGPLMLPVSAPADLAGAVDETEAHPLIALTFDDGPWRPTTEPLLDALKERGAHATFFLIGKQIDGNEDLIRRMVDEGHQIGVHTYDHVGLGGLNDRDFYLQVGRENEALAALTGQSAFALRPPYGTVDAGIKRRSGAPIVLWSIDPEDWKYRDTAHIVDHVVSRAQDGDIILLHDIYPTSTQAALDIIDALEKRGFEFVTVDELAERRGKEPEAGEVYRHFYP